MVEVFVGYGDLGLVCVLLICSVWVMVVLELF